MVTRGKPYVASVVIMPPLPPDTYHYSLNVCCGGASQKVALAPARCYWCPRQSPATRRHRCPLTNTPVHSPEHVLPPFCDAHSTPSPRVPFQHWTPQAVVVESPLIPRWCWYHRSRRIPLPRWLPSSVLHHHFQAKTKAGKVRAGPRAFPRPQA